MNDDPKTHSTATGLTHAHFVTPRSCAFAQRSGKGWVIGDDLHMNGLDAPLSVADEDAEAFVAWVRGLLIPKKEPQL